MGKRESSNLSLKLMSLIPVHCLRPDVQTIRSYYSCPSVRNQTANLFIVLCGAPSPPIFFQAPRGTSHPFPQAKVIH